MNEDAKASIGILFQCLTILTVVKIFFHYIESEFTMCQPAFVAFHPIAMHV